MTAVAEVSPAAPSGKVLQTGRYYLRSSDIFVLLAVDSETGYCYNLGEHDGGVGLDVIAEWEADVWGRFLRDAQIGDVVRFLAVNSRPCRSGGL